MRPRSLRPLICFSLLVSLAGILGCDVPFSPKGDYLQRLVVYSVLDPRKEIQYARVYFTYDVEGVDPRQNVVDPQVANASVKIFDESGRSFVFKDTLLERDNDQRYASDIIAYYSSELVPSSRKRYRLEVDVPQYGKATSEITVPEPFLIFVNGSRLLPIFADSANFCSCFQVGVFGGTGAKGHLTRFFVEYVVRMPGQADKTFRREVPLSKRISDEGVEVPVYPQPDRSTYMQFPHRRYFETVTAIFNSYPSAEVIIKQAFFISYALSPGLYDYYLVAHGFGDPLSVRLDLPDVTNIQNGLGVFGAMAVDSLTLPIR
jgi:hypothetical protein